MYEYIIFDLDGTLTDSMPGILRSINHSLNCHGYPEKSVPDISRYLTLPIDQIFSGITKESDTEKLSSLVSVFRERYSAIGYSENELYPGIGNAVGELSEKGKSMIVCTAKRSDFAEKILELFDIRKYFKHVSGGDVGIYKWQQIRELLENRIISSNSIMIGDRDIDLESAAKNSLDSAGVLWGYGSRDELICYNPKYLFNSPLELIKLL